MYQDEKAERLEKKGLYRRAADRWLDVFMFSESTAERESAKAHRQRCLALAKLPPLKPDCFMDVSRAAAVTQEKMGLSRPNETMFRTYGKK